MKGQRWGWRRRRRAGRTELIERKHRLAGEVNVLTAEVRRLRARGLPSADAEQRLARVRNRHYRTRLEIDRADPER